MMALQVSDRGRDRKNFMPIKYSTPRGPHLSSLTLLNPFNKRFLKQNALRGITKIKGFLLPQCIEVLFSATEDTRAG